MKCETLKKIFARKKLRPPQVKCLSRGKNVQVNSFLINLETILKVYVIIIYYYIKI